MGDKRWRMGSRLVEHACDERRSGPEVCRYVDCHYRLHHIVWEMTVWAERRYETKRKENRNQGLERLRSKKQHSLCYLTEMVAKK